MENITVFIKNFWLLSMDMAIYIIFGIFIASILKHIVPNELIKKQLGKDTTSSVLKAAILGIPLPLCSCSVIPFATALKKEGASNGSVLSFLISTPITGIDSMFATYGFFGWIFTFYRVLTSMIIAITAGLIENLFGKNSQTNAIKICSSCCKTQKKERKISMKSIYNYAINDMFEDLSKPLFIGLLIGALITTFMPKSFGDLLSDGIFPYLTILLLSMPLYICATASLPIAASLVSGGLSVGVAFVLLSAGPATNSVTMSVVLKTLGKRSLVIYLAVIAIFSLLFGYIFDIFFDETLKNLLVKNDKSYSYIDTFCAIIMLFFIFKFLLLKNSSKCKTKPIY